MDSHNQFKVFLDSFSLQTFTEHLPGHTLHQAPRLNKTNPTWILISRFQLLFYSVRLLTCYCVSLNNWQWIKLRRGEGGAAGGTQRQSQSWESSKQREAPSPAGATGETHRHPHTWQCLLGKETCTPSWQDPVSYPFGRFLPSEPGCPQAKHSDVR